MKAKKAWQIVDGSGSTYCVVAADLKSAYDKFRAFESARHGCPVDDIEDVQSITPAGEVVE